MYWHSFPEILLRQILLRQIFLLWILLGQIPLASRFLYWRPCPVPQQRNLLSRQLSVLVQECFRPLMAVFLLSS